MEEIKCLILLCYIDRAFVSCTCFVGLVSIVKPCAILCECLKATLFDDAVAEKGTVLIQNRSPLDVVLPAGLPVAESDVDFSVYQVSAPEQKEYELKLTEGGDAVISTTELENLLEPGISPANFIDKKAELDFIRNHPTIPEEFKDEFISFLDLLIHIGVFSLSMTN